MSDGITIKRLSGSDRECWSPLWASYLAFYGIHRSEEIFHMTFSRLVDESNMDCEGYVAHIDSKAVGIVHCIYHIHLWQERKICYLQDLFVDQHHRGKGVAGKLIRHVYARADGLELQGVYWTTQDFNVNARKLYDKIGCETPFIKYVRP